jgi:hypothetical protein
MINPYTGERTQSPSYDAEAPTDTEASVELTDEQIHQEFTETWDAGDRIGATELVLGRYINASDISENKDLATIVMQPDSEKAYAAALMVKTLEEMAKEASSDQSE